MASLHPVLEDDPGDWRIPLAAALLCGLFGIIAFGLEQAGLVHWPVHLLAYVCGAWFPAREAGVHLRAKELEIHFLMLCVAAGAALIDHWSEGTALLFLFSLSGALEDFAMGRTRHAIGKLLKLQPKTATRINENGNEEVVPVESLQRGMIFRVKPGEQVPVDGEVIEGESAADESSLTGESIPVEKERGTRVLSGVINLWGRLDCRVTAPASESALAKIITLIREARAQKAPSQRLTDRFGTPYTWFVLGACAVMYLVWWLAFGLEPADAFYRTMTLLVVASPCALVISIPSAILAAIAAGAREGVLFRGGAAIEQLAGIRRLALDKTGTITTGNLRVGQVESHPPGKEREVLALAAALDRHSTHPVARAVTRAAAARDIEVVEIENFRMLNGLGVEGVFEGQGGTGIPAVAGRRTLFAGGDAGFRAWLDGLPPPPPGSSEIVVSGGDVRGRLLLQDEIRTDSAPLLRRLNDRGIRSTMLTGDRREAAAVVAARVGLEDFRAELTPSEKVAAIREWISEGENVAMIGDGFNDAPSLAAANVGVAMGVRGSDAALEQADVVLMQDRLENFLFAYDLSVRSRRIILQNLVISLGTIAVLVAMALGAVLPLPAGVLGHEGSTVIVVFNSLRLLRKRGEKRERPRPPD